MMVRVAKFVFNVNFDHVGASASKQLGCSLIICYGSGGKYFPKRTQTTQLQPPLCLQTLCKSFQDKICCIDPMLFYIKSASELHPPIVFTNPM